MSSLLCAIDYGSNGSIVSSDGVAWSPGTLPASINWQDIAWNGSVFCAIADGSATAATSPDGVIWTPRTMPSAAHWWKIVWNGSVFCAVALLFSSPGTALCATSPDGITWTPGTLPANFVINGLAWNGSVFCGVQLTTADISITSPDGLTWTSHSTMPSSSGHYWAAIEWNGTVFCALANGTIGLAATSPDGITWTPRSTGSSEAFLTLRWNGTVFCAPALSNDISIASPDGATWSGPNAMPSSGGDGWVTIGWNGTVFCAIVNNNTGISATSPDGAAWTVQSIDAGYWNAIAAGPSLSPPADPTLLTSSCVSGIGESTLPDAPIASFTASAIAGTAPLAVTFTDTSSHTPISWLWEFGDGTTSTSQNPSHTFAAGMFSVRLTATNAYGSSSYRVTILALVADVVPGGTPAGIIPGETIQSILGKIGFFAVDTPNNQVNICGIDGTVLKTFGGIGSANGKFNIPTTCSVINGRQLLDRVTI